MAAYAIFIRDQTTDQSELDTYASLIAPTLAKYSPKFLAAYGNQEILEGQPAEGVVLVEFPSFALASQWYHSPEYQAVLGHRLKGGRYRAIIVDGYRA